MRVLVQRVSKAAVTVEEPYYHEGINQGLLVFLGVTHDDTVVDVDVLTRKLVKLRIFSDGQGKMNLSIKDIKGSVLLISQFTLYASTKKGNRPSFIQSAPPDQAERLYLQFAEHLRQEDITIKLGQFGAHMYIELTNDGPVTLWMDSKTKE